MRLLIRWIVIAIALAAAVYLVPGIRVVGETGWISVLLAAAVVGFVNAIIRPVLKFLSCPLIVLTLGLFTLVINALCLMIASWLTLNVFGVGIAVDGFLPALIGSIVISVVSFLLNLLVRDAS
jgi:putative membrane protein